MSEETHAPQPEPQIEPSLHVDDTQVEGSFAGQFLRVRGSQTIMIVLLMVYAGFVSWLLYDRIMAFNEALGVHARGITVEHERMNLEWRQDHHNIVQGIDNLRDSIDESTYVQTLTPIERKQLRLEMPETLRHKLRKDK